MLDLLSKLPEIEEEDDEEEMEFKSLGKNSSRYLRGDFEEVEVRPEDLVDLDDEDDEDQSWFVHGGEGARHHGEGRSENALSPQKRYHEGGSNKSKKFDKNSKGGSHFGGSDRGPKKGGFKKPNRNK